MFHYDREGETYKACLDEFNERLKNDFKADYSRIDSSADPIEGTTSYYDILNTHYSSDSASYDFTRSGSILNFRQSAWEELSHLVGSEPSDTDLIHQIFGQLDDKVRYINVVDTDICDPIDVIYAADSQCHVFTTHQVNGVDQKIWRVFPCDQHSMDALLEAKIVSSGRDYVFSPPTRTTTYPIPSDSDWTIRAANRDFTTLSQASDAYVVRL